MCKKCFLTICFLLFIGMVSAETIKVAENIVVLKANYEGGEDKSANISAAINGHSLTVTFLNNIGHVTIRITDEPGMTLDIECMETPNGYIYYIPTAGNYVVVFTFNDGDEYYGEFTVTD